jgi:hypothetical protein
MIFLNLLAAVFYTAVPMPPAHSSYAASEKPIALTLTIVDGSTHIIFKDL